MVSLRAPSQVLIKHELLAQFFGKYTVLSNWCVDPAPRAVYDIEIYGMHWQEKYAMECSIVFPVGIDLKDILNT